jgi:hypothetical protein
MLYGHPGYRGPQFGKLCSINGLQTKLPGIVNKDFIMHYTRTHQMDCVHQIQQIKLGYNGTFHQLLQTSKILHVYNILFSFGIFNYISLIEMSLNETYINSLIQYRELAETRNTLSPSLFCFALEYPVRQVQ